MAIRFPLLSCCFLACSFLIAAPAEAIEHCDSPREAIENLRAPRMASPYNWDIFFGDADKDEVFSALYPLEDDKVLTAGTITKGGNVTPFVTVFDRRNRPVWSWSDLETKGGPRSINIEKVLPLDGKEPGYLLAGNYRPSGGLERIWIGRFGKDGKKRGEHILSDNKRHLRFHDLVRDLKGTGWILAAQILPKDESGPGHSRVSGLNSAFEKTWSRDFVTGTDNRIDALAIGRDASGNGFYIGAGRIESDRDRTQGLLLRFDSQGDIDWQRQFSRGKSSAFTSVAFTDAGDLLLGGGVQATDSSVLGGGWLMNANAGSGQRQWERYYARPETAYEVHNLRPLPDGRVALVLNGAITAHKDFQSHARLILLSPRGEMMNDETFTAGTGTVISDIMIGADDRRLYVGGAAQMDVPDPKNPDKALSTSNGWLVVREAYSDYKDPCPGGHRASSVENKATSP